MNNVGTAINIVRHFRDIQNMKDVNAGLCINKTFDQNIFEIPVLIFSKCGSMC